MIKPFILAHLKGGSHKKIDQTRWLKCNQYLRTDFIFGVEWQKKSRKTLCTKECLITASLGTEIEVISKQVNNEQRNTSTIRSQPKLLRFFSHFLNLLEIGQELHWSYPVKSAREKHMHDMNMGHEIFTACAPKGKVLKVFLLEKYIDREMTHTDCENMLLYPTAL